MVSGNTRRCRAGSELICVHDLEEEPGPRPPAPLGERCGCLAHFIHRHGTSACCPPPALGGALSGAVSTQRRAPHTTLSRCIEEVQRTCDHDRGRDADDQREPLPVTCSLCPTVAPTDVLGPPPVFPSQHRALEHSPCSAQLTPGSTCPGLSLQSREDSGLGSSRDVSRVPGGRADPEKKPGR